MAYIKPCFGISYCDQCKDCIRKSFETEETEVLVPSLHVVNSTPAVWLCDDVIKASDVEMPSDKAFMKMLRIYNDYNLGIYSDEEKLEILKQHWNV